MLAMLGHSSLSRLGANGNIDGRQLMCQAVVGQTLGQSARAAAAGLRGDRTVSRDVGVAPLYHQRAVVTS